MIASFDHIKDVFKQSLTVLVARVSNIHLKKKRIDIREAHKNRTGRVVYYSADATRPYDYSDNVQSKK